MDYKYLSKIESPDDVKKLNMSELVSLASEVRSELIDTVSKNGGHLSSNLGVVELTIAMHKSFSTPKDSFIWDVGHQVYTHKLLTGRFNEFKTIRTAGGLSGFPNPVESKHDVFAAGHSGTSISSAYGLSVAKTLQKDKSYTVAVIGDGSFTGGLVYEALNNAGRANTNLIVILNDNEMSISPNVGAMAKYLAAIRTNPDYYNFKGWVETTINNIPVIGSDAKSTISKIKRKLKDSLYNSTFFEDMGFSYMGPIDGHNIEALCNAMESAKGFDNPVLIHVLTKKGKGYNFAEMDPSVFHGISKFDVNTGEAKKSSENYSSIFGDKLCELAEKDDRICAITAAMALGTGLEKFSKKYPSRFFDVGIAEEHAVTFAGGVAAGNMIPVFAVYSTFLQRSYDELVHDVAMQNQKVILAVDRAGFVGEDGRSHQGLLDVAFIRSIPKSVIYSPSSYDELRLNLENAIDLDGTVVSIRYPRGQEGYLPNKFVPTSDNYSVFGKKTSPVSIVTYGAEFSEAIKAKEQLKKYDIDCKVVKLNRVWPLDNNAVIETLKSDVVLFAEEGIKSGGIGEAFGLELLNSGFAGSYAHVAVDNTFVHHAPIPVLREEFGLSADELVKEIMRRV